MCVCVMYVCMYVCVCMYACVHMCALEASDKRTDGRMDKMTGGRVLADTCEMGGGSVVLTSSARKQRVADQGHCCLITTRSR
jgi:hypothetical protein